MLEDLRGKAVLITGASIGIGAAAALEFGRLGANVGVHYNKNAKAADEPEEANLPLVIGGIAGGVVVAAGIAAGVVFIVQGELQKDEGFTYVIDTSGL